MSAQGFGPVKAMLSPKTRQDYVLQEAAQAAQDAHERRVRQERLDAERERLLRLAMAQYVEREGGMNPTQPPGTFARPLQSVALRGVGRGG